MANIAFILLCHKDPEAIVQQAQQLTAVGDYISIHFDARAPREAYALIQDALKDNPNVAYASKRVKCGWGEWSLVQATLHALKAAVEAFPRATHFYMVSGDCMAIKSAKFAKELLDKDDCDYIESFDFFESDWIKTGMKEERLIYRHFFNERTQKTLFYQSWWAQRKLGLERDIPADLQVMIGSQWWCLRRRTVEWILDMTRSRPDVMKFFRSTWIPDETFFQTLVRHLVPEAEIRSRTLTFLMFTDYGMPVTFYNDHYDLLLGQDFLFARKISPEASSLKEKLGRLYASDRDDFKISNEGTRLFRELLIVACKKWHVAKRLLVAIKSQTDIPTIDYLFNEEDTALPDLGGIQKTIEKRTRHRRVLMRMLFDYYDTKQIIVCMDTSNFDLMEDFFSDRSTTRLLEIECDFSDDYLKGHAERMGLAGEQSDEDTMQQLLPIIRNDVVYESDRIRDSGFRDQLRLRETASSDENAERLAKFLRIPLDTASKIAQTPDLFSD